MQHAGIIGLAEETKKLFQVYLAGFLLGTLNANDKIQAKILCATQFSINWRELHAVEVIRS